MTQQIEISGRLTLLDYDNPETWKNSPAPIDVSHIQRELTKVGGLIPDGNGELSGKPNFIIVWGQEYKVWINGKMRLMFDDDKLDANHYPNHFAVTQAVYERAIAWYLIEEQKRQDAMMRCDWKGAQIFPDFADYLERFESTLDYFPLLKTAEPEQIAKMLPDGYRYLCGLWTYEEIGKQSFFVLQWESPEMIGGEKDWLDNRYDWSYFPEIDNDNRFIDVLGEFPHHGQYSLPVLRIADKISDGIYQYREPTVENVIQPLKQLLEIRDRLSDQEKSAEYQTQKRFEDFRKVKEKDKKIFNERFEDAKPVGKGNPTNVPTVKVRDGLNKHGKGRRIL